MRRPARVEVCVGDSGSADCPPVRHGSEARISERVVAPVRDLEFVLNAGQRLVRVPEPGVVGRDGAPDVPVRHPRSGHDVGLVREGVEHPAVQLSLASCGRESHCDAQVQHKRAGADRHGVGEDPPPASLGRHCEAPLGLGGESLRVEVDAQARVERLGRGLRGGDEKIRAPGRSTRVCLAFGVLAPLEVGRETRRDLQLVRVVERVGVDADGGDACLRVDVLRVPAGEGDRDVFKVCLPLRVHPGGVLAPFELARVLRDNHLVRHIRRDVRLVVGVDPCVVRGAHRGVRGAVRGSDCQDAVLVLRGVHGRGVLVLRGLVAHGCEMHSGEVGEAAPRRGAEGAEEGVALQERRALRLPVHKLALQIHRDLPPPLRRKRVLPQDPLPRGP